MSTAFGRVKTTRVTQAESPAQAIATGTDVVVRGYHMAVSAGSDGIMEFRGGGSGGDPDHEFDVSGQAGVEDVDVPAGGMEPLDGLHVTLPAVVVGVTIFYEEED